MMSFYQVIIIISVVFILAYACCISIFLILYHKFGLHDLMDMKNAIVSAQVDYEHGRRDNELLRTEDLVYDLSSKVLDFTKEYVSQIVVLKVKAFVDTNDMKYITREKIKNLIGDIAVTVNGSINRANIDLDCLYFTKDFYDKFIVETTVIMVKELLEKEIDNYDPSMFEGVNNYNG